MKACQKTRRRSSQEGSSTGINLDALRRQYSFRPRRCDDDQDGQAL
jgi:hypothetical protein